MDKRVRRWMEEGGTGDKERRRGKMAGRLRGGGEVEMKEGKGEKQWDGWGWEETEYEGKNDLKEQGTKKDWNCEKEANKNEKGETK